MLQGWGLMLFGPNWIRIQSLKKHLNNKMEMSHRAEILMRFLRNLDKLSYYIHNETKLWHSFGICCDRERLFVLVVSATPCHMAKTQKYHAVNEKTSLICCNFVIYLAFIKHPNGFDTLTCDNFFFPLWNIYWKIMWTTENCKTSTNECWDNCTN